MSGRAARLQPLVAARLAADRARLADCLARIRALRAEAEALRSALRTARAGADASEMLALDRWQAASERRARAALEAARRLEPERSALARRLARSLGREQAVADLAAAEHAARKRARERRAEETVPWGPPPSVPAVVPWRAAANPDGAEDPLRCGAADPLGCGGGGQSPWSPSSGASSVGTA